MKKKIEDIINEDIRVKKALLKDQTHKIAALAKMITATIKSGNKVLVFGNGGSAADSIHMTAELVGRFRKERRPLAAISLASNISSLTALSNDYDFEYVFERQVEALGKRGDLAIGISTSGKSKNVRRAIQKAAKMKMKTAVLMGKTRTELYKMSDISIMVPSNNTPRVQEAHATILHILCELVEDAL